MELREPLSNAKKQSERVAFLEEMKKTGKPYAEKWIWYDGSENLEKVYEIPLEYLVYNKYNGRILSKTKSFEKQSKDLNPESKNDIKIIEQLLWDSKPERNEFTKADIKRFGQKEYGIVTKDGIIIDGNRRGMILNQLFREGEQKNKFRAIILDDVLENSERKILELETTYQMGQDSKVDYNPIEKYLKCKQLDPLFPKPRIASMMSVSEQTIEEWLEIMKLMDDYLDSLGYSGIYTRLEKREGHFVDLNNYLKAYKNQTKKLQWACKDSDITDLKAVYFDYIRVPFPVQYCRIIAKPSAKYSFFCNKKIWSSFSKNHFDLVEEIKEKSADKIREENPKEDVSKLLSSRDKDWGDKIKEKIETNLADFERSLNDHNTAKEPLELLRRAEKTLEAIDTEIDEFKKSNPVVNR